MDVQTSYIFGIGLIMLGIVFVVTREVQLFNPRDEDRPWRRDRSRIAIGFSSDGSGESLGGGTAIAIGLFAIITGFVLIVFPELLPRAIQMLMDLLPPGLITITSG